MLQQHCCLLLIHICIQMSSTVDAMSQLWTALSTVVGVQMSTGAMSQAAVCYCGIEMSSYAISQQHSCCCLVCCRCTNYKWAVMLCHKSTEHGLLLVYKWAVIPCHKLLSVTVVYKWALIPCHNSTEHGLLLVYKWAAMLCHKQLSVDTAVCWYYCGVQMSSDA